MLFATAIKSCRVCGAAFEPFLTTQVVCSRRCAARLPVLKRKEEAAVEKANIRARKEAVKPVNKLKAEAWAALSKWIRWRDRAQTCIDCGQPFEPQKPGGSVDAGHFLARSTHPHLKWDERNIHAQRKNCNRPGGTIKAKFKAGVVGRIGLAATEALEADNEPRRYRADDYRRIRDEYRARLKAEQSAPPNA